MIDGLIDDAGKATTAPRDTKTANGRSPAAANKTMNVSTLRDRVRKMQQGMRSSDDISQGIEALEAVAALATSSRSSGKLSPRSNRGSSSPPSTYSSSENTSVSPSGLPATQLRSAGGRGMAALNKVGAGSRRVWESTPSVGGGKDGAGSKASRSLLRVSSGFLRHHSDMERRYASAMSNANNSSSSSARSPLDGGGAAANLPRDSSGARRATEISSSSDTSSVSPELMTFPGRETMGMRTRNKKPPSILVEAFQYDDGSEKKMPETKKINAKSGRHAAAATSSWKGFGSSGSMRGHDTFSPPTAGAAGEGANGTVGGFGERGSIHGRLKARGWWAQAHDKDVGGSNDKTTSSSSSSKNKAQPSAVGILKAENAELRAETRRLEDALIAAQENAIAAEERSKELSRQAASRVRIAEAQRTSAEEVAKDAEARAYSLSATVQVLKRISERIDGSSAQGDRMRAVEAEVTAAYQSILQDMDMERAILQQRLAALQRQNDMLRSKAVRRRPLSGRDGERVEEDEEENPLPTPRSFVRPQARGMSTARQGGVGGTEALSSEGSGARRGARALGEWLGTRVRLVQLEGLDALAGTNSSSLAAGRAMTMTMRSEALRVAEPSAEAPRLDLRQQSPELFPWSKEWTLWYGCVTLVAAPGSGAAPGDDSGSTAGVRHSILFTDAALYVLETCFAGGSGFRGSSTVGVRTGSSHRSPGGECLCRLERHLLESLSLPLETRALSNGDEVAVRSNAVVVRLKWCEDGGTGMDGVSDSLGSEFFAEGRGGAGASAPVAAGVEQRGYLWISCDSNESRGELVEHLCQWHQWRGHNNNSNDLLPAATTATKASGTTFDGGGDNETAGEETLEVDQILLKELLEDLAEESSLNVTDALLLGSGHVSGAKGPSLP